MLARIPSTKAQANMTMSCAIPSAHPRGTAHGGACESSVPAAPGVSRACRPRTRALLPLLGCLVLASLGSTAASAADRYTVTSEQRSAADKVASNGVLLADLAAGAPASYTIKRGDTLWSIASLFLTSPWRWPELWGMNRTQIQNPHLIYPGQTLYLVKTADGRAQLVMNAPEGQPPAAGVAGTTGAAAPALSVAAAAAAPTIPTVRLSPRAREQGADEVLAISSIPNNAIEPFLAQPLIVASDELEKFPRIVATPQDRVFLGSGDMAYVRGIGDTTPVVTFHVFRPAKPIYDPDDFARSKPIAYEALYLGSARVLRRDGDITTVTIVESKQEIGTGDRLVPIDHQELISYVPRRPEMQISGRIVSAYNGVNSVGAGTIVALNRGSKDGLEIGSVLAVLRNGKTIVDRTQSDHESVKLPDEGVGHVFVFRLFDHMSYALLVGASGPIQVGDRIAEPNAVAASASFPSAGDRRAP